jgi:hypothetical protein
MKKYLKYFGISAIFTIPIFFFLTYLMDSEAGTRGYILKADVQEQLTFLGLFIVVTAIVAFVLKLIGKFNPSSKKIGYILAGLIFLGCIYFLLIL